MEVCCCSCFVASWLIPWWLNGLARGYGGQEICMWWQREEDGR